LLQAWKRWKKRRSKRRRKQIKNIVLLLWGDFCIVGDKIGGNYFLENEKTFKNFNEDEILGLF
jgi:hypothetical protein